MFGFVDEVSIHVSSGRGGPGCVSFRREKYAPKGGPDGGDGGRGGDVIFVVKENLKTLSHLKAYGNFVAESGNQGTGKKRHGKDGNPVYVDVPPGTLVRDASSKRILKDMTGLSEWLFLNGGKGGKGNQHFATSVKQAPRYAQPGLDGKSADIILEINIIADIGFVGLPNAGKSSLLAALTNASPKIGSYAFTTLIPNLGVMDIGYGDLVLADIPGIIEGASEGAGLGLDFLKHISRTSGLAILLDAEESDPKATLDTLLEELRSYEHGLEKKPRIVVVTKLDLWDTDEERQDCVDEVMSAITSERVIGVSSFSGYGFSELKKSFVAVARETE